MISVATGCMGARLLTLSWRVSNECTRSTVSYAAIGCTDALLVSRRETVNENKTGVLAQTPLFAACLYLHMRSIGISIKLLSTSSPLDRFTRNRLYHLCQRPPLVVQSTRRRRPRPWRTMESSIWSRRGVPQVRLSSRLSDPLRTRPRNKALWSISGLSTAGSKGFKRRFPRWPHRFSIPGPRPSA